MAISFQDDILKLWWQSLRNVFLNDPNKQLRPKLKFYLFPLTRLTLKKGPTQKKLFQFSVKNFF